MTDKNKSKNSIIMFKALSVFLGGACIIGMLGGCNAKKPSNDTIVTGKLDLTGEETDASTSADYTNGNAEVTEKADTPTEKVESTTKADNGTGEVDENEANGVGTLRNEIVGTGNVFGVAFVGYVDFSDSVDTVCQKLEKTSYRTRYGFVGDIINETSRPRFVNMPQGTELYIIVPSSPDIDINVYRAFINENGERETDKNTVVYSTKNGEPFVIRCNVSEVYSDTVFVVTDKKSGKTYEYSPSISLKDGTLARTDISYDFSVYPEKSDDNGESKFQKAVNLLREKKEIAEQLREGKSIVYIESTEIVFDKECFLFSVEEDPSGKELVSRKMYGVPNIMYGVAEDGSIFIYRADTNEWSVMK